MRAVVLALSSDKSSRELNLFSMVAGKPLLLRVLESLVMSGVRKITIITNFGEIVREIVENRFTDVDLSYVECLDPDLNELECLLRIEGELNEPFILCKSNCIFDYRIVEALINCKQGGAVTLLSLESQRKNQFNPGVTANGLESKQFATSLLLCSTEFFNYLKRAIKLGERSLSGCIKLVVEDDKACMLDLNGIPTYVPKLRKHVKPFIVVVDDGDLKRVERILIEHAGKEPSDLVAKYLNKPIEDKLVLFLANKKVTPNQITMVVNLVAYSATFLFLTGWLLIASILTFLVGVLDGVDGKLARIKGLESKLGLMEHPFDMLFEFSWYAALAMYSHRVLGEPEPLIVCMFIILAIAFYRFVYDQFRKATGVSLDDYSFFERYFRRIAGRRNLYNIPILVSSLLNQPYTALIIILIHAILTAFVYAFRACIHLRRIDLKRGRIQGPRLNTSSTSVH